MSQQSVQNMYMRMTLQATPGGQADDYRSGPVLLGRPHSPLWAKAHAVTERAFTAALS